MDSEPSALINSGPATDPPQKNRHLFHFHKYKETHKRDSMKILHAVLLQLSSKTFKKEII